MARNYQYIYGRNTVVEAIKNNRSISKIFIQSSENSEKAKNGISKEKNSVSREIENLVSKRGNISIQYLNKQEFNNLSLKFLKENCNHQGVIAEVFEYNYYQLDDLVSNNENSLIVALDGLEDPHNLGAIVRTSEISGVDGIIIPKNRSVQVNSTVSKVSTGAIEYVKVAQVTNIRQTLKELKAEGYWIVGAEYTNQSIDFWKADLKRKLCVVIGSEGKGISRIVREECDYLVKIPMWGKINSLNASVSAALIIYEARRQQNN